MLLALDIETLGRMNEVPLPPITCVCFHDGVDSVEVLLHGVTEAEFDDGRRTVLDMLDGAPALAGFNAARFDLPYIKTALGGTDAQLTAWVRKCVDPFMCLRDVLRQTCSLQALLGRNGLGAKTGSGADAILLARAGKYRELLDYCTMDAALTYRVCVQPEVRFSRTHVGAFDQATGRWRFAWAPGFEMAAGGRAEEGGVGACYDMPGLRFD